MKIKVAVLRGGPSYAYHDSLKTGAFVLNQLREIPEYEPVDVFISRDGAWYQSGLTEDAHKILSHTDVAWNAMHGPYGEDGEVQKILESLNTPFVGSGSFASSLTHNKELTKEIYNRIAIPTPRSIVINEESFNDRAKLMKAYKNFMFPVIVKPSTGVRGLGLKLAYTFEHLVDAVKSAFQHSPKVLIEEYVGGTSVTCSVLEKAKGENLYAFLPTHIKVQNKTTKPRSDEMKKIEEFAKEAHQALGLRHFSTSDFRLSPSGKIYILETNTVPVLSENSIFNNSLKESGWKARDFIDHSIKLALDI